MALGLDFWIQLLVVLAALFYGARKGGMGLGLIGGIGLIVLIFGFGLKPGHSTAARLWLALSAEKQTNLMGNRPEHLVLLC